MAATTPPIAPWVSIAKPVDVDDYKWELYNVAEDFSQSVNLADKQPAKLRELQDLFWIEAARYNVLPIDNSRVERFDVTNRPSLTTGRTQFTYYPGMLRIPEGSAPDVKNKSWSLTAEIEVPQAGAQGLIATHGGRFAGWGLYLLAGKPVFHYNLAGVERYSAAAKEKLAPGKHTLKMSFKYDGGGPGQGGTATLSVDGKTVAESALAAHDRLPHVARRDARHRRGHRDADQRGLQGARSPSPARSRRSRSSWAAPTPRSRPRSRDSDR